MTMLAEPMAEPLSAYQRQVNVPLINSALYYASIGLHVFPLQPGSKIPWPRSRGFKDATTDPDRIRAWWWQMPTANIGIATGHHVDVIDIDGPAGVKSWAALLCEPDGMPPAYGTVNTPRPGGTHLYVAAVQGRGNKTSLFPGIDYRGLGGFVVAPPSVLAPDPRRNYHGPYLWRRPLQLPAARQVAA